MTPWRWVAIAACLWSFCVVTAVAFAQPTMTVDQALRAGKVKAEIRGLGSSTGDAILIQIQRLVPEPLRLTLTPGTVLTSVSGTVQDMVVARLKGEPVDDTRYRPAREIALRDDTPRTYLVEAYCLDFHKANPGARERFTLSRLDERAGTLIDAGLWRGVGIAVIQSALWIDRESVTDAQLKRRFRVTGDDFRAARELLETLAARSEAVAPPAAGTPSRPAPVVPAPALTEAPAPSRPSAGVPARPEKTPARRARGEKTPESAFPSGPESSVGTVHMTAEVGQRLQVLPWALGRLFDRLRATPSQADEAITTLEADLAGKDVAVLFGLQPSTDPGRVALSFPKHLRSIPTGQFLLLSPSITLERSKREAPAPGTPGLDSEQEILLTGTAFVRGRGDRPEQKRSAYTLVVGHGEGKLPTTSLVVVDIVDGAWRRGTTPSGSSTSTSAGSARRTRG